MSSVGKAAKRIGKQKAAVLKRLDPKPIRDTPAKAKGRKDAKHYGFSYEFNFIGGWKRSYEWFVTKIGRDQAYVAFKRKNASLDWVRDFRLEQR